MSAATAKIDNTVSADDLTALIVEAEDSLPALLKQVDALAARSLTDEAAQVDYATAQAAVDQVTGNIIRWTAARRAITQQAAEADQARRQAAIDAEQKAIRKSLDKRLKLSETLEATLETAVKQFHAIIELDDNLRTTSLGPLVSNASVISRHAIGRAVEAALYKLCAVNRPPVTGGAALLFDAVLPNFPGAKPPSPQLSETPAKIPTLVESVAEGNQLCIRYMETGE